ncbi:MAG: hypothetical protein K2K57_02215 [Oscillospiraceae bacterium]|nr:hypothetical protein [Oscillospiraceae bacterium]
MKKKFNGFFNKKTENNPDYFGRRQKSAGKISTAPPAPFGKNTMQPYCSIVIFHRQLSAALLFFHTARISFPIKHRITVFRRHADTHILHP